VAKTLLRLSLLRPFVSSAIRHLARLALHLCSQILRDMKTIEAIESRIGELEREIVGLKAA
jgi:hypothetical protein